MIAKAPDKKHPCPDQYFSYFFTKHSVMLLEGGEVILLGAHNICSHGKVGKISVFFFLKSDISRALDKDHKNLKTGFYTGKVWMHI